MWSRYSVNGKMVTLFCALYVKIVSHASTIRMDTLFKYTITEYTWLAIADQSGNDPKYGSRTNKIILSKTKDSNPCQNRVSGFKLFETHRISSDHILRFCHRLTENLAIGKNFIKFTIARSLAGRGRVWGLQTIARLKIVNQLDPRLIFATRATYW